MDNSEEEMIYKRLEPADHQTLLTAVSTGDVKIICSAIDSIAEYDSSWDWLHDQSLELLEHSSWEVRATAARSLGTLARIHPEMPTEKAIAALKKHLSDTQIAGYVEDALDDIGIFRRD